MSLKERMNKEAEQYGAGQSSGFFKFEKTGDFKFRILTSPVAQATHFFGKGVPSHVCYGTEKGCPFHGDNYKLSEDRRKELVEAGKSTDFDKPSVKFVSYVLDRADGKVKLGELPWSVVSAVADFEEDEDYGFKSYPMPYDIKVKYDKENKDPKSIYKTLAAPNRIALTTEEENALHEKSERLNPESYVETRKEKSLAADKESGAWDDAAERRKASVASAKTAGTDTGIEYPEEDIKPEDIPF